MVAPVALIVEHLLDEQHFAASDAIIVLIKNLRQALRRHRRCARGRLRDKPFLWTDPGHGSITQHSEDNMRIGRNGATTNRRSFLLNGMTLAGAAALPSATAAGAREAPPGSVVQLAQAVPRNTTATVS